MIVGTNRSRSLRPAMVATRVSGGDLDNLIKYTLDALQGVLYQDDRAIMAVEAIKIWAEDPASAGSTTVRISAI